MDTSETNIKMCKKAKEIQRLTPCDNSLCLFVDNRGKLYWRVINTEGFIGNDLEVRFLPISLNEPADFSIQNPIWLPRQDQLQEMIGVKTASEFSRWCYRLLNPRDLAFAYDTRWSMEQLWLAFVMKEKYNKIWDGKNWIAVKS